VNGEPWPLCAPSAVADLLRRRGLRPISRLGQNFLIDANILRKVVEAAQLDPADGAIEIGTGLGVLTRALSVAASRVLTFELDAGLVELLRAETLAGLDNVRLMHEDFLGADLEAEVRETLGPGRHAVVANIPYGITTPVLVRLIEHRAIVRRVVLMVQREVADRLTAQPATPEYGSLTLLAHLWSDVARVALVSRRSFLPAPAVDSAIVRLELLGVCRYPDLDPKRFTTVVRASFQQRRKTLGNSLQLLGWSREVVNETLRRAGISADRRGETLSGAEFAAITRCAPMS
jgi:16S rRNA (adenine1518-N6/adenine1519-N6)-dimethyltransferase